MRKCKKGNKIYSGFSIECICKTCLQISNKDDYTCTYCQSSKNSIELTRDKFLGVYRAHCKEKCKENVSNICITCKMNVPKGVKCSCQPYDGCEDCPTCKRLR